ncbi:MAG: PilZ domain-containing protein [Pseudomonadota bacterium]
MGEEKRKRLRVPFQIDVELHTKNHKIIKVTLDNISLKGVFVETQENITEGEECLVVMTLQSASDIPPLEIKARVARATPSGVGLNFLEMEPETFVHLRNIIAYNYGDADKVDDEIFDDTFQFI